MTEREEFYSDIFTCIFEDYGTNSWRQVAAYKWKDLGNKYWGRIVEIGDGDLCNEWHVDKSIITKGINALIKKKVPMNETMRQSMALAYKEKDAGDIDAYDADMILQAGLFGELRYG